MPLTLVQNSVNFNAHFCYVQVVSNLIVKVALCGKPYCKDIGELKIFFLEFLLGYLGAYKRTFGRVLFELCVGYGHECLYSLMFVFMLCMLYLSFLVGTVT